MCWGVARGWQGLPGAHARRGLSSLARVRQEKRCSVRSAAVCFVESKPRPEEVATATLPSALSPDGLPTSAGAAQPWSLASAMLGALHSSSEQLLAEEFEEWDQEAVWKAVMELGLDKHRVAAQPDSAAERASASRVHREELATRIMSGRLTVQSISIQLLELQTQLAAGLPAEARPVVEGLMARAKQVEAELAALRKGAAAAAKCEQRLEQLRWELHAALATHAQREEDHRYRSLLASLDVERQLLLVLEAKEALLERKESQQQSQKQQGQRRVPSNGAQAEPHLQGQQQAARATWERAGAEARLQWERAALERDTTQRQQEIEDQPLPLLHPAKPADDYSALHLAPPSSLVPAAAAATAIPQLRLVSAGAMIPHPSKAETGGEDAFFVSAEGLGAAGVADGVGGWSDEGIDPSIYPRQLLAECQEGLAHHEEPLALLLHAHERAHAPGSCTVCLAAMGGAGRLSVVSLGDCGAVVVRDGQGVVFRAEVQEHQFNLPYQMASPHFMPEGDHPEEAHQYEVEVQPGDVLVMGSDGLFDNLWEEDLQAIVRAHLQDLRSAEPAVLEGAAGQLASELAQRAHAHASDPAYRSPFAVERHERMVHPFVRRIIQPAGGKLDDISVVVGVVCHSS